MNTAFLDFLNNIESARNELKCSKSGAFYRGHSNHSHKLVPSLLRNKPTFEIEHNLYVDSFARGTDLFKSSRNSWEFLSIMQHYGIPTRLLDWSESLSTALFFALSKSNLELQPGIWITNAFNLNKFNDVSHEPRIITIGLDEIHDYENSFIKKANNWKFDKPVFLQIPWVDKRLVNQKGFFTFHSNDTPMNENCYDYVKFVKLEKDAIPYAKRFLEYSGVNEDSVFPDLEGFGRFMKKKYKM